MIVDATMASCYICACVFCPFRDLSKPAHRREPCYGGPHDHSTRPLCPDDELPARHTPLCPCQWRLAGNAIGVATTDWRARVTEAQRSDQPRQCWADRWGGYLGSLRNMMGLEDLCLAFYDQPGLIEKMMEQRTEVIIVITAEVLRHTTFETFWFWETWRTMAGP